ncbi:unnamed protein product [Closterium sp. NIES-54]
MAVPKPMYPPFCCAPPHSLLIPMHACRHAWTRAAPTNMRLWSIGLGRLRAAMGQADHTCFATVFGADIVDIPLTSRGTEEKEGAGGAVQGLRGRPQVARKTSATPSHSLPHSPPSSRRSRERGGGVAAAAAAEAHPPPPHTLSHSSRCSRERGGGVAAAAAAEIHPPPPHTLSTHSSRCSHERGGVVAAAAAETHPPPPHTLSHPPPPKLLHAQQGDGGEGGGGYELRVRLQGTQACRNRRVQ